jgi:hypothetical protein
LTIAESCGRWSLGVGIDLCSVGSLVWDLVALMLELCRREARPNCMWQLNSKFDIEMAHIWHLLHDLWHVHLLNSTGYHFYMW